MLELFLSDVPSDMISSGLSTIADPWTGSDTTDDAVDSGYSIYVISSSEESSESSISSNNLDSSSSSSSMSYHALRVHVFGPSSSSLEGQPSSTSISFSGWSSNSDSRYGTSRSENEDAVQALGLVDVGLPSGTRPYDFYDFWRERGFFPRDVSPPRLPAPLNYEADDEASSLSSSL